MAARRKLDQRRVCHFLAGLRNVLKRTFWAEPAANPFDRICPGPTPPFDMQGDARLSGVFDARPRERPERERN